MIDYDSIAREVLIASISFGEGAVEIAYMEKRQQADDAGLVSTLIVDRNKFTDQVTTILDEAEEIIDKGLLMIRNPEESFDPRKRIGSRPARPQSETEVDDGEEAEA